MRHPGCQVLLACLVLFAGGQSRSARADKESAEALIVFVGDIMLGMLPGQAVLLDVDPFEHYAACFREADLVIGNLECVVASGGTAYRKPYTFKANPRVVPMLGRWFHGLSLANNHTGDFGEAGLVETIDRLTPVVPVFGAGRNLAEARRPLILKRNGVRIAFLAYNEFKPRDFAATATKPGTAWAVEEQVLSDIRKLREQGTADVVIPFLHWGDEYEPLPNDHQRQFARAMIDAGASAVIGAHPHVTQGAGIYRDCPVIYSLGNCVFDGFEEEAANTGWGLRLKVDKRGVTRWETIVHRIGFVGIPEPDWEAPAPSGQRGDPVVHETRPAVPAGLRKAKLNGVEKKRDR